MTAEQKKNHIHDPKNSNPPAPSEEPIPAVRNSENLEPQSEIQEEREKEDRMSELEQQLNRYKDQILRKAAEFDNFRKRTEAETANFIKFANEDLLVSILPIVDDIERSLKSAREHNENNGVIKGLELILQKMLRVLEQNGVKPFESAGKDFDVNYHDALLQVSRPDVPPQTVVEEVERGYMFHERVLRHAKVIVSTNDQTAGAPAEPPDDPTSTSSAG